MTGFASPGTKAATTLRWIVGREKIGVTLPLLD
jgi:hypothetical protein